MYYAVEENGMDLWLVQEQYDPRYEWKTESVFAQCNGSFGVRAAGGLPSLNGKRGMFVAGLFNRAYDDEVTELVNCPDITAFHLLFEQQEITPDRTKLLNYRRALCLRSGELVVDQTFQLEKGQVLKVTERRLASMKNPQIFLQQIQLEAVKGDFPEIVFETEMNGQQTNSGVSHFKRVECRVYEKRTMHLQGYLSQDSLGILSDYCCFKSYTGSERNQKDSDWNKKLQAVAGEQKPIFTLKRRGITAKLQTALAEKECWRFEKYSCIRHGSEAADIDSARNVLNMLREIGYEAAEQEHRKVMESFWKRSDIHIEGASKEERAAIAFAQYHILGMMPWDRKESSIAAKGLTGEGYKGHVFWDTELFILPYFTYLFPEQAKNLLEFRYRGLPGARKKAEDFGYQGAMYPWETAADGTEETPLYAALNIHTGKANKVWSGLKEHHVTADIGYALEQYLDITGDQEFLRKFGYEMLFEIAQFWVSRAVWDEKKKMLVIRDVIGPDEYTEHIDNNAYTNYMAHYCVYLALSLSTQAEQEVPELCRKLELEQRKPGWKNFLERIYLPKINENQILPQDDTFLGKKCVPHIEKYKNSPMKQKILQDYSRDEIVDMQVLKQADVVMLMNLFPRLFAPETVKKNVLFYEERTIHDSSLSLCVHAQACAAIHESELAWKFFEACTEIDLDANPCDSIDGIHAASMGGIWGCVFFGFAGIRFQDHILYIEPQLPQHWKFMKLKLCIRGSVIEAVLDREKVWLKTEQGESADIFVCVAGKKKFLEKELLILLH